MTRAILPILVVLLAAPAASGQATDVRDELLRHFIGSSSKVVRLSEAMPADLYSWSPGEGVMTVATVYAHIARYNYMYLEENLGIAAPEGVDWENAESLTDKGAIRDLLVASVEHARESLGAMSADQLTATTILYGREVPAWAVITQLVAHMNEHVGQSVSYARMNGIVPPWSM